MSTKVYRIILLRPDGSKSFFSWVRTIKKGKCTVITTRDETSNTIMLFNTKEEAEVVANDISGLLTPDVKISVDVCDKSKIRRQF